MRRAPEFAFDVASHDAAWLNNRLEKFGATFRGTRHALALYLDTPDGAIAKLGLGFGLRQQDKMTLARGPRRAPALGARRWMRFVEELSPAPHMHDVLECCLQRDAVREALALSVACAIEETLFAVQFGGAWLEIRVDRCEIAASSQKFVVTTARFHQISGGLTDFLQAVREIAGVPHLRLCAEPMLVRARRRLYADGERPIGAFAPRLGRAMDMREAFQTVAQACFDQFLLNEAAIRIAREVEAVHQCRVALRRMRTALRLFRLPTGKAIEGSRAHSWRHDFKAISTLLRDARDLDVLLDEQAQPLVSKSPPVNAPPAASAALLNEIKARREGAYDRLLAALSGPQANGFYLDFALWIGAGDFGAAADWNEPLVAFLQRRLSKTTRNLLKRGDEIETDSEEERHRTRIAAKNLRYSAEFFECLTAPKTVHKRFKIFIAALKEIQEILGAYNDQIVARQFFTALAQEPGTHDAEDRAAVQASALALAHSAALVQQEEFLRKARRAFHSLGDAKPFWTKITEAPKPRGQRDASKAK
jgi:triphosphatase